MTSDQIKLRRAAIRLTQDCREIYMPDAEQIFLQLRDEFRDLPVIELYKIARAA